MLLNLPTAPTPPPCPSPSPAPLLGAWTAARALLLALAALVVPGLVLAQAEQEPNGNFARANLLSAGQARTGSVAGGDTGGDNDYFYLVLPAGGSVEVTVAYASRSDAADGTLFVYDARGRDGSTNLGSRVKSNIPSGTTARDTFRLSGRAPGDTLWVGILYSQGPLDYSLRYTTTPPTVAPDPEPNDGFARALPLAAGTERVGQLGYVSVGVTDRRDDYRILLPSGGSVEVYVAYTSTGGDDLADGTLYVWDVRGRDNSTTLGTRTKSDIPAGATVRDTFRLYSRAPGDTLFVTLFASDQGSYDYRLSYAATPPTVAPDPEPNDGFARALPLTAGAERVGQLGYYLAGVPDREDNYRLVVPAAGAVEIAVAYTATGGNDFADGLLEAYDARQQNGFLGSRSKANIRRGTTVRDTFRLTDRRAGDTIYVRLYYSEEGSLDYRISTQVTVGTAEVLPAAELGICLYPNPVARGGRVTLASETLAGAATLTVVDAAGRRVSELRTELAAGIHVELPPASLPAGRYAVYLRVGERAAVAPLVVVE